MKILITGGAGFIGSHLAEALLQVKGQHKVFVVDNLTTGKLGNIEEMIGPAKREIQNTNNRFWFFRRDISSPDNCSYVFNQVEPDVVVHAAASYKDPRDWRTDTTTNVLGTVNVIEESIRKEVKRFIYLQTSLCYGPPQESPITLSHPLNPKNSYAITKTAAELLILFSGLNVVSFRLANCYGPRNLSGPIPAFYKNLAEGQTCTVMNTRRDFVFINDLIYYLLAAIEGKGAGVYHISTGADYSIREIYDAVFNQVCVAATEYIAPNELEKGVDDVDSILLDPSETIRDFGMKPVVPLLEGIRRTVDWYKKNGVGETYTHLRGYDGGKE